MYPSFFLLHSMYGRLAQLVRATALHAVGHRFESCSAHHTSLFELRVARPPNCVISSVARNLGFAYAKEISHLDGFEMTDHKHRS